MRNKPRKQPLPPQGYRDIFGQRDARKGPLILEDQLTFHEQSASSIYAEFI